MRWPKRTIKERLDQYSIPEPFSGCLLWAGAAARRGYGVLNLRGSLHSAHRLSYEEYIGPIPAGFFCLHKCDTPACINPNHLYLGTHKDNMKDMKSKHRSNAGEKCSNHVLTNEQIEEIRSLYRYGVNGYKKLGKQFGVDWSAIYKVVKRKRWKHI